MIFMRDGCCAGAGSPAESSGRKNGRQCMKTPRWRCQPGLPRKHPHGCGEDPAQYKALVRVLETPPRVWGRRTAEQPAIGRTGNTPTGVGKTDFTPECPAGTAGSAKCLALEQLQGAGAVSGRRQELPSDTSGTTDRQCGQGGPTGRLGSGAEVTHDRNGKDAERKSTGPGRRTCREAAPAGIMAFRPADPHGGSGTPDSVLAPGGPPATGGTADIDAALAALERRTRELVACADALEQCLGQQIGVRPRLHMGR